METLAGSYLKLFPSNRREKERGIWCPREIAPCGRELAFLVQQKRVRNGASVSFRPKRFRSVSPLSSAQTSVESEEIQTISSDQPRTVHVRFKLYKECAFGEQFVVVGDDPILGLWDPSEGVPLTWSEGHVWTAELDIPIGRVISYKFILKGDVETILWQPGPDRILETFETEKVISVSDDWDNAELQTVIEEDLVDLNEESSVNSLMVAEDLNGTLVEGGDNHNTIKKEEEMSSLLGLKDEMGLVLDEEVPVLVPGLVPTSTDETGSDETKDSAQSELKEEHVSASLHNSPHCAEAGEVIVEEKRLFSVEETSAQLKEERALHCTETSEETSAQLKEESALHCTETSEMMVEDTQMESNILAGDMQWGRRTLQKFLANFGFI